MLNGAVSTTSLERSRDARYIAQDMYNYYMTLYKKQGIKKTKTEFNNFFIEVAYNTLDVLKLDNRYKNTDKQPYIQAMQNMLKAKGYTFFLRNETNRMAVVLHAKMVNK